MRASVIVLSVVLLYTLKVYLYHEKSFLPSSRPPSPL